MTETPERYKGMDDRHRGVPLFMEVGDVSATLKAYEERAEKAERALLGAWNQPVEAHCSHIDYYACIACQGRSGPADDEVAHAEDCIVPGIMERYAE